MTTTTLDDQRSLRFYHDTMGRVEQADAAITACLEKQAKIRDAQRTAERQYGDISAMLRLQIADEADEAKGNKRYGNAESREALLALRLSADDLACELRRQLDSLFTDSAENDVALDAAVRQRKGALAALAYATAFLQYAATEEKAR